MFLKLEYAVIDLYWVKPAARIFGMKAPVPCIPGRQCKKINAAVQRIDIYCHLLGNSCVLNCIGTRVSEGRIIFVVAADLKHR